MSFLNGDFIYQESQHLEFKESAGALTDDLWETYSAFANTEGGEIVLGIRENADHTFTPVGVGNSQDQIDAFWMTVRNPQRVSRDVTLADGVQAVQRDGFDFVVITVPRAERDDKPVSVYSKRDKRFVSWIRRGSTDQRASEDDLRLMSYDSEPGGDRRPLVRFDLGALCESTVNRYREAFRDNKPNSPWNKDSAEDFLFHIGAVAKGHDGQLHPTEAGLLAFGYEYQITNFLPRFLLDYQENVSGNSRWDDRIVSQADDWSGNVFDFYLRVTERWRARLAAPFSTDEYGMGHGSRNPVTEGANEALTNALVHAYYGNAAKVKVTLTESKLDIVNSGSFLIDKDVAIAGGFSEARNPTMMRIFGFVGASDRAGSGLNQIWTDWKAVIGQTPVISEEHAPALVHIALPLLAQAKQRSQQPKLTSSQREVLELVRNAGSATSKDIERLTGRSERAAQRSLKALNDMGLLSRDKRGGYWVYTSN